MNEKKPLESRVYNFEIRAEENERGHIITGRPIVYESKTDIGPFDEIIRRGALDKTDFKTTCKTTIQPSAHTYRPSRTAPYNQHLQGREHAVK